MTSFTLVMEGNSGKGKGALLSPPEFSVPAQLATGDGHAHMASWATALGEHSA
jgi:hypothetical protein